MLIQTRKIVVEKGYADQVLERFSKESPIDSMEGLIDRTVMVNRRKRDLEEVMVMIRWESKEAWKNWEKSPAHLEGHRNKKNKPRPEYIKDVEVSIYELHAVKEGIGAK